jgi:hypothetical protein
VHFAEVGAIGLSVPMGLKESRGVAQSGSAAVSKSQAKCVKWSFYVQNRTVVLVQNTA